MPTPRQHQDAAARQRAYRIRRKLARLQDRPELPHSAPLANMPSSARWKQLKQRAEDDLQTLLDEMEAYRDMRSEDWQEGDRGQDFQDAIDTVQKAIEAVQEID